MRQRRSQRNHHRVRMLVLAMLMIATGAYGYWSAEELREEPNHRRVTLAFRKALGSPSDLRSAIALAPRSSFEGSGAIRGNAGLPGAGVTAERGVTATSDGSNGVSSSSSAGNVIYVSPADRMAFGSEGSTFVVASRAQPIESRPSSRSTRPSGSGIGSVAEPLVESAEETADDKADEAADQVASDELEAADSEAEIAESVPSGATTRQTLDLQGRSGWVSTLSSVGGSFGGALGTTAGASAMGGVSGLLSGAGRR